MTELEGGELAEFLGRHRPFSHLGAADLAELASAATVTDYGDGQLVLDAFTEPTAEVFVVLAGRVHVWNDPARLAGRAGRRLPLVLRNRRFGAVWAAQVLTQAAGRMFQVGAVWWLVGYAAGCALGILIGALTSDIYEFDPHRLEMMVHRLRRKAQDAAGQPLPLLTSRGQGYLFASDA